MIDSINSGLIAAFQKIRRKFLWKFIYNRIYFADTGYLFQTLNYGYAYSGYPDGIDPDARDKYPTSEIYGYQLYSKVLSDQTLKKGMKVLEIGCGTGHGLADLAELSPDVEYYGLDLSKYSIKRAQSRFSKIKNLKFEEGNAVDLPFENNYFDLVVNIESSHCYIDLREFFSEVYRVLKPGGGFMVADFRQPKNYDYFLTTVQVSFELENETDITGNIVRSLEKLTPHRKKIFDKYFKNRFIKGILAKNLLIKFSGIKGSTTFERFKTGYWKYFICTLKKN